MACEGNNQPSTGRKMEDQEGLSAAWTLAAQLFAQMPDNVGVALAAATVLVRLIRSREAAGGYLPTYSTAKLAQGALNGSQGHPSETV